MSKKNCPETREAWLEISKQALRSNAQYVKKGLSPKTQLMAVVKANAYGHGAVECARIFLLSGASQLAVATVEEGIELRKAQISAPILLLAEPPETAIPYLLDYDIMPTVQTAEFGLAFGEAAAGRDTIGRYHLGIDTGMTRNGVDWRDVVEVRDALEFHRGIECAGTFTHFATADTPDNWDFALQHNRFCEALGALQDAGLSLGLIHCDNSSATLLRPETHYDMVRVGISLYGLHGSEVTATKHKLKRAMSVHALVTRTSYPPVGSGVSYGMTWRVSKPNIQIASFPVGYADGFSREMSGRAQVLCNGQAFPQVGAICMDHAMFAVEVNPQRQFGAVHPVSKGDEVILLGTSGDQEITAEDIAALRGSINYEVVCDFGMRLEHVYV